VPRILIDISRLFYRRLTGRLPTGIDRVGLEYLRHYAGRARAILTLGPFTSVLSRPDSERAFRLLLDAQANAALQRLRLIGKAYLGWWMSPDVAGCVVFNTSHTGLERARYAARLRQRGARPVFFVHDLIPVTHPEYCRPGERERHLARMRTAVTIGRGIIVNSQDTLEALRRFCRESGLRMPPVVVAPLATSLAPAPPGPRPIAAPYFVVVGTIEPRKNHLLLLQAWRNLAERLGEAAPRLVVIGQRGWQCEDVVELLEQCRRLNGIVTERGDCGDAELANYLRHAQALLVPSFAEGYGIPVAEALSLGVPVIASNLAAFREIAGDVPDYADPVDGMRWMELIVEYADPRSARRAAQLERMARFRAPTWEHHLRTVDDFLRRVGDGTIG
jgi:glycosyltransferase involved in cell wall biosynthesis